MRLRRAFGRALVAGLLALLAMGLRAAGVETQPCWLPGVEHQAHCGKLLRPLDLAAPARGAQIEIHFAVLPALARNKATDPVFFLAGGPGQSAIDLAGPLSRMLARFGNRRDIVLVDQRGTGRSAPLYCDEDEVPRPLAERLDPRHQAQRALVCLRVLQDLPHGDLRHYRTLDATADLDAVRQALGAARINLIGVSYGTRAALDYLRQHPNSVRRLVLDGVAPADMGLPEASAQDAQSAFDAMLRACEAEAACRMRHPGLRATWQALLDSLPREVDVNDPLTGQGERLQLTREMLLGMVRGPMYSPALSAALPAALQEAARGRLAPLIGLSSALKTGRGERELAQGMHFSVVCSEDAPRMQAQLPLARDFGAGLAPLYQEICAAWPRGDVPPDFYVLPRAPVATLLLSGGLDPVTPPRHGDRVALALGPMARHEVVPNAGHGLLALPCVRDVVYRFIDAATDAQALQIDTACARAIPRPPAFEPAGTVP